MVLEHLMGMLSGMGDGVEYVDRGDPSAYDWTHATLTTDGTWRDMDCSGVVPAGATAIHFYIYVMDGTPGVSVQLRENGNTDIYNVLTATTQVDGIPISFDGIVKCDAGRVVEYLGSNTTFTAIYILIRGWLI